jgi:ATP-dependent Lhr-like helicase
MMTRAVLEVREHFTKGLPLPTDRRITLERWGEYVIIQCCFGHLINRTLSRILGYSLSEKYGSAIGVQQDPYRIILKTRQATLQGIEVMLRDLANKSVREIVLQAIIETGMFKRRFLHVAKKFGAISKDADLSSVSVAGLIEGFKGTPVFEEALRFTLQVDTDIEKTEHVLKQIASKDIELASVSYTELTPIARTAMEELNWKSDLVSADRMKHLIIESTRARLLNEARTVVCTNCWNYVENLTIKSLSKGLNCPECSSSKIGMLNESEETVQRLCETTRVNKGQVPKRFIQNQRDLMGSVELLSKYNFPAALVLAGKGLRISDAITVLKVESSFTDKLIQLILDAEQKILKRRFIA